MIRFSKKGITFNYNNDEITWLWWWARKDSNCAYFSLVYNYWFLNFRQYWMKVGGVDRPFMTGKIRGFDIEEALTCWLRFNCREGHYVILNDINVEAKPATFWRSIPDKDKSQLLSDFVVLKCKDESEVISLCDSISRNFAVATGIRDGEVVYWNDLETA